MNLTDADTLKFQRGTPFLLDDICAIYPLTLGEIVDLGYDKFQLYLGVLTTTKPMLTADNNELKKLLENLTDFQYMLLLTTLDAEANTILKESFQVFCKESEVTFSLDPAQIILGPLEEKHILNEEKFYDFQRVLKRMYFLEQEGEEIIIYED